MDGNRRKGTERSVLDRIVLTLLSLADLAEQAAGRSASVRLAVLTLLWQADAAVRDYIATPAWHEAGRQWSPAVPVVRYGSDPSDAFALAASLRALALIICNMAAQIRRLARVQFDQASGGSHDSDPTHGLNAIFRRLRKAAVSPIERLDTS